MIVELILEDLKPTENAKSNETMKPDGTLITELTIEDLTLNEDLKHDYS